MKNLIFFFATLLFSFSATDAVAQLPERAQSDTLVVVWTSGDIEVAEKMVYMYTYNAAKQKWFDHVIFVVWGPSARLLSESVPLQKQIVKMEEAGIKLQACIACARMYGVVDNLKGMGIEVKGMGVPLSDYLKKGYSIMTF